MSTVSSLELDSYQAFLSVVLSFVCCFFLLYSVQANGRVKLGKSKSIDPYTSSKSSAGGPSPILLPLRPPTTAVPARHSIRSIDSGLGEDPNHSDRETASEVRDKRLCMKIVNIDMDTV